MKMNKLTLDYLRKHLVYPQGDLLRKDLVEHGILRVFSEGQTILKEAQHVDHVPLVIRGGVKVIRHTESDQNIFLYFIRAGETCTMTLSSCLKRETSRIHAQTIVETEILLLPSERVYYYTKHFPSWNEFTLESFRAKFDDILTAYDRLAFSPLEERLLSYLNDMAKIRDEQTLVITHAELASEMAASRVSVSRVLKQLERDGKVELSRNAVRVR